MKIIIATLIVGLPALAFSNISEFSSKYGMVCQPTEVFEQIWQDCGDTAVLDALDQIQINAPKDEIQEHLMNVGQVVQNNVLFCQVASVEVSFDDFPQAEVAIYKDATTNRLSGAKVKDVTGEEALEMVMTQTGFASGTPIESTLKVSKTPKEEGGSTYKAWKTKQNGEVEEQTCVVYSQD